MKAALDRWHLALAVITVEVCAAIVRRKVRPTARFDWASRLEAVARDMRETRL